MANFTQAAGRYFPITYKTDTLEHIFTVAAWVWLTVLLVLLLLLATVYIQTLREIKDATPLQDNIYRSKKVKTPGVYGIFRPKILLPEWYADGNLEMIVLHEKTHIQRMDNLWRLIALTIAAAHWFNPFGWLFLKLFLADMELSCDEMVLQQLGGDSAKLYAHALLKSKEGERFVVSGFGGAKIHARITNILSFRKLTWLSAAMFTVLIAAIFYVLLTNAG